jgi:hypothetical protein
MDLPGNVSKSRAAKKKKTCTIVSHENNGQVVGVTSLVSKDVKSRDFRVVPFLSPAADIMRCPSFSQTSFVTNKFGTEIRDKSRE